MRDEGKSKGRSQKSKRDAVIACSLFPFVEFVAKNLTFVRFVSFVDQTGDQWYALIPYD